MADELRMGLLELLRNAEVEKDADFVRDGVSRQDRSTEWLPRADLGHAGGDHRTVGTQSPKWQLLPQPA
jgi:hypothetical protein